MTQYDRTRSHYDKIYFIHCRTFKKYMCLNFVSKIDGLHLEGEYCKSLKDIFIIA